MVEKPNRKVTSRKTLHEMERFSWKSDWKVKAADRDNWMIGFMMISAALKKNFRKIIFYQIHVMPQIIFKRFDNIARNYAS